MMDDGLLVGEKRRFAVESGRASIFTPGLSFCCFYLCSPYPTPEESVVLSMFIHSEAWNKLYLGFSKICAG